jgi:hypothetical protein
MNKFKRLALGAAVVGAAALGHNATSAVIDGGLSISLPVQTFCADAGGGVANTYQVGIFQFTCYISAPAPSPAAAHMATTTLLDNTEITIDQTETPLANGATEVAGNLNISGLATSQAQGAGSLSYYVELAPGGDVDGDPTAFFDRIDLTQELQQTNNDSVQTRKQLTGQVTALVPTPTFTADLIAEGNEDVSVTCGTCRRYAVTDTFDADFYGLTGRIRSMSNAYTTVVPVPAPVALVALGMLGLGVVTRRRRS